MSRYKQLSKEERFTIENMINGGVFCQCRSPHIKPQQKHHKQGNKEEQGQERIFFRRGKC